jgi:fructokinase
VIAVLGEALVDRFEDGDRPPVERPGGSPANVAVALARLDVPTRLVTQLGDDARGRTVLRHLCDNGVAVATGSVHAGRPTSVARTVVSSGQASYQFSVGWEGIGARGLRTLLDDRVDCVHTGSIAALAPLSHGGAASVLRAVAVARGRSTITFDPNCRPSVMGDAHAVRRRTEDLVAVSDVVKASEDDVRWLYSGRPPEAVMRRWLDLGAMLVVVTHGRRGSSAATRRHAVAVPAEPVEVVDTVGAGDSFMAGLLAGLHQANLLGARARDRLSRVEADPLRRMLRTAARVAAITCGRRGADSPTVVELAAADLVPSPVVDGTRADHPTSSSTSTRHPAHRD